MVLLRYHGTFLKQAEFRTFVRFRKRCHNAAAVLAAASMLVIVIFHLIAQMAGAGQLVQLLSGLDYVYAACAVGALMVCYVIFGGMMVEHADGLVGPFCFLLTPCF